jgi:hypothetical protein
MFAHACKVGLETLRKREPILMVESLADKPELAKLATELGFKPYHFAGGRFVPASRIRIETRS